MPACIESLVSFENKDDFHLFTFIFLDKYDCQCQYYGGGGFCREHSPGALRVILLCTMDKTRNGGGMAGPS